jgi:hypothetical protein
MGKLRDIVNGLMVEHLCSAAGRSITRKAKFKAMPSMLARDCASNSENISPDAGECRATISMHSM